MVDLPRLSVQNDLAHTGCTGFVWICTRSQDVKRLVPALCDISVRDHRQCIAKSSTSTRSACGMVDLPYLSLCSASCFVRLHLINMDALVSVQQVKQST
jgi:hypothetical protein